MKRYKQKLREVWLQMPEFRPWLRRDPEDSYRARCRFCKCGVNTKICDLRAHALTKKHMKRNAGVEIKKNDSDIEDDVASVDQQMDYKRKVFPSKRIKCGTDDNKNNIRKIASTKSEMRSNHGPDYEALIESLALYEPEQALFSNDSTMQTDHQVEKVEPTVNVDEEMITNAVTVAINNMKDSAQIFGDFVADRLRHLSEKTSEYTKDKIMQILLDSTTVERTIVTDDE